MITKLPVTVLIITPPGREASVDKTLRSIHAQDFQDFDIVLVDDGDTSRATELVCDKYPRVKRYPRRNRKAIDGFGKPAIPYNLGIIASRELVVMHSGDVMYTKPTDLGRLVAPHFELDDSKLVTLASCEKIGEADGSHFPVHARENKSLLFSFGSAFRRSFAVSLGGFDEGYEAWGHDEEDMALLMKRHGARIMWLPPEEVLTHHQFHPWVANSRMNTKRDVARFEQRKKDIAAGRLANEGRTWGEDK